MALDECVAQVICQKCSPMGFIVPNDWINPVKLRTQMYNFKQKNVSIYQYIDTHHKAYLEK
jgi:hypothetical protein